MRTISKESPEAEVFFLCIKDINKKKHVQENSRVDKKGGIGVQDEKEKARDAVGRKARLPNKEREQDLEAREEVETPSLHGRKDLPLLRASEPRLLAPSLVAGRDKSRDGDDVVALGGQERRSKSDDSVRNKLPAVLCSHDTRDASDRRRAGLVLVLFPRLVQGRSNG